MPSRSTAGRQVQAPAPPRAVTLPLATVSPEVRRAVEDAMTTSDLEVARKGAHLLHMRLIELERELLECKDRACVAESFMLSLQASKQDRRQAGGKHAEEDWPQFLPQIVKEGDAICKSAHKAARVYFLFFSTYAFPHIWGFQEPGWSWNDASVRFDPDFPDNCNIGQALELVQAVDQRGLEWLKRGTIAYREQFEGSLAFASSESIKRVRDNGAEIFEDLKDRVNAGFAKLQADDVDPLTYRLLKQDPVILDSFSNSLFLHESAGAQRLLPGIDDMVGIWEGVAGNFESSPLEAQLIYKNYEVVAGEEFQSDVLFRSMRKKTGLVFDKRSQLKGIPLGVTPGLIARIALSPESVFAGDGKGPLTKIEFHEDADEMLEMLMSIWDEPGGRKIREVWTANVFPSLVQNLSALATRTDPTPNPAPRKRGDTAAQMIARNREAVAAEAATATAHQGDVEYGVDSYRIPEDSFYADHTMRHIDASIRYDYGDFVTSSLRADDHYGDKEDDSDTSFHFDEDAGDVLPQTRQTSSAFAESNQPLVFEPEQHSGDANSSFLTSSPPRQVRARAPPVLVPAVPRHASSQVPAAKSSLVGPQDIPLAVLSNTGSARGVKPTTNSRSRVHGAQQAQVAPLPPPIRSSNIRAPSATPRSQAATPASIPHVPSTMEPPPAVVVANEPAHQTDGDVNTRRPSSETGSRRRRGPAEDLLASSKPGNINNRPAPAHDPAPAPAPPPMARRVTRRTATATGSATDSTVNTLASGVAQLSVVAEEDENRGVRAGRTAKKGVNRGRGSGGAGAKSKKAGA